VQIEVENVSPMTIRISQILVNGSPHDRDQVEFQYDLSETFSDRDDIFEGLWNVFALPPQLKENAKLNISKKNFAKSGDEFRIELKLERDIVYPRGRLQAAMRPTHLVPEEEEAVKSYVYRLSLWPDPTTILFQARGLQSGVR